jgi:hypothetical protein
MSVELQARPVEVTPTIESLLSGLRRRIRSYVWIQGVAVAVAWLALAFWITLALDWSIEPPPAFRALVLAAVGAVLLWIIYHYILARVFVPLADKSMAVLLERKYRDFGESLITTVELAERPHHAAPFNRDMLTYTTAEALAHTRQVKLNELLQNAGLMRAVFASVVLVASVAAFAVAAPEAFKTWSRRTLLLSHELWPRTTRLSIEGFADGMVKVARGSNYRVTVNADRRYEVPEIVQIRYRTDDGSPGRDTMSVEAATAGDERQPYSFEFPNLLASVTFDIVGGDDRLRDYRIEVVDNPTVTAMRLFLEYPDYMKRAFREVPVTGLMQIPMGTKVEIRAQSNKPLAQAIIEQVDGQEIKPLATITQFDGEERRRFSQRLGPVAGDMRLQFRLRDTDDIVGRDPVRLDLTAVADEAPRVGLQLAGIGKKITTRARLPAVGEVGDDYGVDSVWWEYQIGSAPAERLSFNSDPRGYSEIKVTKEQQEALDLKELQEEITSESSATEKVEPDVPESGDNGQTSSSGAAASAQTPRLMLKEGQELTVVIKARDRSTLEGGPFVGTSDKYELDVVTPDELLAALENRETELRRRFETIVEEFSATRELLSRVQFGERTSRERDGKGSEPEDQLEKALEAAEGKKESETDAEKVDPAEQAKRDRASRMLAVERTVENTERAAHETRTVGTAFHEILEEMANNRIDTPALQGRLRDEIADPLVRIADLRMPVLVGWLKDVQKNIDDPQAGQARLNAALREADSILLEMQAVLDKMIEMATYKELVEKLRQVIEQQEALNQRTKKEQVNRVRNLLEE